MAKRHISEADQQIEFTWICSKCGKKNHVKHTMNANKASSFSDMETYTDLQMFYGEKMPYEEYRMLGLNCGCSKCHHKEPWTAKDNRKLENSVFKLLVFSIMSGGICFLVGSIILLVGLSGLNSLMGLGILSALLIVIPFMVMLGYRKRRITEAFNKDAQIKRLPITALPVLEHDEEQMITFF